MNERLPVVKLGRRSSCCAGFAQAGQRRVGDPGGLSWFTGEWVGYRCASRRGNAWGGREFTGAPVKILRATAGRVRATVPWDTTAETVDIGVPSGVRAGVDFTASFEFSEAVTGFDADDVTVTGCTKGSFSGSGSSYDGVTVPDVVVKVKDLRWRGVRYRVPVSVLETAHRDIAIAAERGIRPGPSACVPSAAGTGKGGKEWRGRGRKRSVRLKAA